MSAKTIIAVIILAMLTGVIYVLVEKNFFEANTLQSAQILNTQNTQAPKPSSVISLPSPDPTLPPITESSNLLNETENLQMRDYSSYFEDLKETVGH